MSIEPLQLALLQLCTGGQPPEELPGLATDALVRGLDSPSLRELAGASPREYEDNRDLFLAAVRELGFEVPDAATATRGLACFWAGEIARGALAPYEGARLIWWEACGQLGDPDDLTPFVAMASSWEEYPEGRAEIERDIVAEAKLLLADG